MVLMSFRVSGSVAGPLVVLGLAGMDVEGELGVVGEDSVIFVVVSFS
jgi:hypothetical protein